MKGEPFGGVLTDYPVKAFAPYPDKKEDKDIRPLRQQVGGDHYKTMKIQPIEYIMANDLGWCEANCIKYVTRYKQKGQKQDIEKAIHYLQILLDQLGG